METLRDRMSGSEENSSRSPKEGKLRRIAGHTRGLVEDLREWIDLRLDLAILELQERIDRLRNEIALGLAVAFFGFFAVLFVLTTVALGLGWVLGHPFWGFLIVSALLLLVLAVLVRMRPDLVPPSDLYAQIRGQKGESKASPAESSASEEPTASESTS